MVWWSVWWFRCILSSSLYRQISWKYKAEKIWQNNFHDCSVCGLMWFATMSCCSEHQIHSNIVHLKYYIAKSIDFSTHSHVRASILLVFWKTFTQSFPLFRLLHRLCIKKRSLTRRAGTDFSWRGVGSIPQARSNPDFGNGGESGYCTRSVAFTIYKEIIGWESGRIILENVV